MREHLRGGDVIEQQQLSESLRHDRLHFTVLVVKIPHHHSHNRLRLIARVRE